MKKVLLLFSLLVFSFSLTGCKGNEDLIEGCSYLSDDEHITCTFQYLDYLDTHIVLTIYLETSITEKQYNTIHDDIEDILKLYHQISDKYNTYDNVVNIKTINDDPTTTHTISSELYDMIDTSLTYQKDVDNLFNIALSPVLEVWHDYRESCNIYEKNVNCILPENTLLDEKNQYTNPLDITLIDNTITLKEHMSLDLGGMAKGYVSDKVRIYLDSLDVIGYIFNNGQSNISVSGVHPVRDTSLFHIGIVDPTDTFDNYLVLGLSSDLEIITSGDYQQYGITDSLKYHHIIDPNTLYPSMYMHSVTLIYDSALLGDIYSTALFNMSIEDGLEFVNNTPGLEAVFYSLDDEVIYSNEFYELYVIE